MDPDKEAHANRDIEDWVQAIAEQLETMRKLRVIQEILTETNARLDELATAAENAEVIDAQS